MVSGSLLQAELEKKRLDLEVLRVSFGLFGCCKGVSASILELQQGEVFESFDYAVHLGSFLLGCQASKPGPKEVKLPLRGGKRCGTRSPLSLKEP